VVSVWLAEICMKINLKIFCYTYCPNPLFASFTNHERTEGTSQSTSYTVCSDRKKLFTVKT